MLGYSSEVIPHLARKHKWTLGRASTIQVWRMLVKKDSNLLEVLSHNGVGSLENEEWDSSFIDLSL